MMYRAGDTAIVASVRADSAAFEVVAREPWFVAEFPGQYISHDLHPEGDRIMAVKRPPAADENETPHKLVLVVNWASEVRARLAGTEGGGRMPRAPDSDP
jgi:hypothetical protein